MISNTITHLTLCLLLSLILTPSRAQEQLKKGDYQEIELIEQQMIGKKGWVKDFLDKELSIVVDYNSFGADFNQNANLSNASTFISNVQEPILSSFYYISREQSGKRVIQDNIDIVSFSNTPNGELSIKLEHNTLHVSAAYLSEEYKRDLDLAMNSILRILKIENNKHIESINKQLEGKEKWVQSFMQKEIQILTNFDSFGNDFIKSTSSAHFTTRVHDDFFSALNYFPNKEKRFNHINVFHFANQKNGVYQIKVEGDVMTISAPFNDETFKISIDDITKTLESID
ncbi:MAG: hypothetical protein MRY83_02210 [Flavobacteriales bacterium]|nr:hypothetical protein [Flavobacteriales bacterium]